MLHDGCEILIDAPMAKRGRAMLCAMASANQRTAAVTDKYAGRHGLLMLYGAGLESRRAATLAHLGAGGRVASWDLGYWDREVALRLSLDGLHPDPGHLAMAPATGARGPARTLREDANPAGPILLVGLGKKSEALYRLGHLEWERRTLAALRLRFPGRAIAWRPKGKRPEPLEGTVSRWDMPIEHALWGCSLVVCRHSNVAVDAAIAGVPVECEGGAAAALFGDNPRPTRPQRAEFLRRLGWWNWSPSEAADAWVWIRRTTA